MPPKYITLATKLITDIESGALPTDTKLPSLRCFSTVQGISMTTAMNCYRYLEQQQYLTAEPKKGFYVKRPMHSSQPRDFPLFDSKVEQTIRRPFFNSDIETSTQSLGMAQIDHTLTDEAQFKRSLRSATRDPGFRLGYDDPLGSSVLRGSLAQRFNSQGLNIGRDDMLITHGCLDAVLLALEVVSKPGSVIAVSSPCYAGLLDMLSLLNRAVLEIPSTEEGIDLQQLEQAMETQQVSACLLTANYQNPTGHSLSNDQKSALALMAQRYRIPIIEDDVYREISHDNTPPLPIKYFDNNGWVLWCSSVSKTLAAGLRIGWCAPGRYKSSFLQHRRVRSLGHNQPLQLALAHFITAGHYATHVNKINRALMSHKQRFFDALTNALSSRVQIHMPEGGLVMWVRIIGLPAREWALALRGEGIIVLPGDVFSTTSLYDDCFRINIGIVPTKAVMRQITRLTALIRDILPVPDL